MTPRQTRFAQVLAWIADAGPEDLADLRREIEAETQDFQLAEEEHRIHLAGLRRLESILAERCGEALAALDKPPVLASTPVTIEWKEVTADDFYGSRRVEAEESEASSGVLADKFETNNDSIGEIAIDEREPPASADDPRSIEERIRDLLKKVGPRSPQQIGAALGVEKSVVWYALNGSAWFFPGKVNGRSPYETTWKLTGKGKAS